MSSYRMQVTLNGSVVNTWMPGGKVETDLIVDLCRRLERKGLKYAPTDKQAFVDELARRLESKKVGMLVPKIGVVRALREAYREQMREYDPPPLECMLSMVRESLEDAILDLKKLV